MTHFKVQLPVVPKIRMIIINEFSHKKINLDNNNKSISQAKFRQGLRSLFFITKIRPIEMSKTRSQMRTQYFDGSP